MGLNACEFDLSGDIVLSDNFRDGEPFLVMNYISDDLYRMAAFQLVLPEDKVRRHMLREKFEQLKPYERDGVKFSRSVHVKGALFLENLQVVVKEITYLNTDIECRS